jgi:hypothetical protein
MLAPPPDKDKYPVQAKRWEYVSLSLYSRDVPRPCLHADIAPPGPEITKQKLYELPRWWKR